MSVIAEKFEDYSNNPNDNSATAVISAFEDLKIDRTHAAFGKTTDKIYQYQNMGMLERQVLSSHALSVKLAFKLKLVSDGAFSQDLDIILGQLIRINPELFLTELKSSKSKNRLRSFLNYGGPYVDRISAQCHESILRAQALKSTDPDLAPDLKSKLIAIFESDSTSELCNDEI